MTDLPGTLEDLLQLDCRTQKRGDPILTPEEVRVLRALLPEWGLVDDGTRIRRRYRFDGFSAAVEFLTKLAPIANSQDHHPDIRLTMYRWLEADYRTNSIGGLSLNDFIMAARTDRLYGA